VSSRAGLDTVVMRHISSPWRDSKPVTQRYATELSRLLPYVCSITISLPRGKETHSSSSRITLVDGGGMYKTSPLYIRWLVLMGQD